MWRVVCYVLLCNLLVVVGRPSWSGTYGMLLTILSNGFLLPVWVRARGRPYLQWQVAFSFLASTAYHIVWYLPVDPDPFQRLDHGMAVALMAVVLLQYIGHVSWPVIFLAVVSASVPYGNYISSAVVGLYFAVPIILLGHSWSSHFSKAAVIQALATALFLVDDPIAHASWHVLSFTSIYYLVPDL